MSLDLRELIGGRVLIGDGAMGTLLAERGIDYRHPYARANITHPELVRSIHEEYVRAGANFIETNTFAANRIKLADHELGEKVREINTEGARLARQATENAKSGERGSDRGSERALVLGAIGPLGKRLTPIGAIDPDDAKSYFREQAEALLEGGADVILLETFTDLDEMKLAYEVARDLDLPIMAYKTFVEDGETLSEGLPAKVAKELSGWDGVGLAGANCTVGPQRMVGIIEQMSAVAGPVAAFPNPGLPQLIGGVVKYNQDVEHFAEYGLELAKAGAQLIGGCCGTTPAHVKALSEALRDFEPEKVGSQKASVTLEEIEKEEAANEPVSDFWQEILHGFAITVEVDLPRGNDITSVIEASRKLQKRGVHAIDISDGARARLRMHPVAVAKIIQDELGIEVIPHISCRDRNIIGLQADLLSAAALDVRNILAVTGDPVHIGDYPEAGSVFDTDSVGLVHILGRMNAGYDLNGNSIGNSPGFLIGASFNPTAEDLPSEIDKLKRKVDAGAHAFWTQPVFEIQALENALEKLSDEGLDDLKILPGLMPLRSARQAEFLHHEVPGIEIPKHLRDRLSELSKEDAPKYGVEVAQGLIVEAKPLVNGAYIMPPATAPELAGDVVEALGEQASSKKTQKS